MKSFELDGLTIAYEDVGTGTPIVLVHCSSSSHKEWKSLISELQGRYRVLAPDLIGYGKSDRWPMGSMFDPFFDVKLLIRLLEIAGEPAHLTGHSYGAAMSLEAARTHGDRIKSLTLVEPVSFHLLRLGGKIKEWNRVIRLANAVINSVERGNKTKSARSFMGFWIGYVRWWLMPKKYKEGIIATMDKVAKEFGAIAKIQTSLEDYQQIEIPTRLIVGARTRKPAHAVADILGKVLPDFELKILAAAEHMSPLTHAPSINALISEHITRYEVQ